ncbi:MAG: hypothetical protein WB510_13300, partial [Candidatus Sulfotelmatobacter sp.]
ERPPGSFRALNGASQGSGAVWLLDDRVILKARVFTLNDDVILKARVFASGPKDLALHRPRAQANLLAGR